MLSIARIYLSDHPSPFEHGTTSAWLDEITKVTGEIDWSHVEDAVNDQLPEGFKAKVTTTVLPDA